MDNLIISKDLINQLTSLKNPHYEKLFKVADRCRKNDINLYIDAEYSHLQPAVRFLTFCLMSQFNHLGSKSAIYNTYQCYLKDSFVHLREDMKLAKSLDIILGCKLVRGAYLAKELERSQNHSTLFPIHDSYEATNNSYDSAVKLCLENNVRLTVATHNLASVNAALTQMENASNSKVNFAQINGLGDHISHGLAEHGCEVLKLLPIGNFDEVFSWLIRYNS